MANSFSVDLVLDRVSKRTVTYLGNVFAPLNAFSTDFSNEEYTQGQNVRFQVANAGPTVQTNPTNWESGDWGLTNVNILVNQYSASLSLTPRQLNNEFRLDQAIDIGLQAIGKKFMGVAFAPFTSSGSTNFTNVVVATANISQANIANAMVTAWARIARGTTKNAILDATSYSKLLPTQLTTERGPAPGIAGYDAVYLNTDFSGAGTNVYGAFMTPGAVAILTGLPQAVPSMFGEAIQQQVISVPLGGRGTINQGALSNPTVQLLQTTWLATATRTMWISYDWMQGASAIGDANSGVVLLSTTNP
jgi:hypothetical protein